MEYIGFIKEEDRNIRNAKAKDEMFSAEIVGLEIRQKVITYLEKGQFFDGVMSYARDIFDGESIGPMSYHTDGKYIWPVYYSYYLSKYQSVYLPEYFIQYLESIDYSFEELDKTSLDKISAVFTDEWGGRYKKMKIV